MSLKKKSAAAAQVAATDVSVMPSVLTRVYVDIHGDVNRKLEIAAVTVGKTKKAFIESAILAAVQQAQDENAGQPKRK